MRTAQTGKGLRNLGTNPFLKQRFLCTYRLNPQIMSSMKDQTTEQAVLSALVTAKYSLKVSCQAPVARFSLRNEGWKFLAPLLRGGKVFPLVAELFSRKRYLNSLFNNKSTDHCFLFGVMSVGVSAPLLGMTWRVSIMENDPFRYSSARLRLVVEEKTDSARATLHSDIFRVMSLLDTKGLRLNLNPWSSHVLIKC